MTRSRITGLLLAVTALAGCGAPTALAARQAATRVGNIAVPLTPVPPVTTTPVPAPGPVATPVTTTPTPRVVSAPAGVPVAAPVHLSPPPTAATSPPPAPTPGTHTPFEPVRIVTAWGSTSVSPIALTGTILAPPPTAVGTYIWSAAQLPGSGHGHVTITGHHDWAGTNGFLYPLVNSMGTSVTLYGSGGQHASYRITSISYYLADQLPKSMWTTDIPETLQLVTCGGPFLATGHYAGNTVAEAVRTD